MATVTTTDEAIAALRTAIGKWGNEARALMSQATAVATGFSSEATREARRRKTKLAALQSALAALRPDADATPLRRQIADAEAALARASQAKAVAEEVERDVRALERSAVESVEGHAVSAEHELGRRLDSLSGYRAGGGGAATSSATSPGSVAGSDGQSAESSEEKALRGHGLVSVPLETTSHTDNPVIDGYHKGGATGSDYRWAVETWETVVRPGVAAGATREDFAQRDVARGATGFRRTAGVYDMFLGGERLVFSRKSDGSLDVTNGRHRIDVARGLGITHLPGEIR